MIEFKRYNANMLSGLDMGKINLIKNWLYIMKIKNYVINNDFTIDVKEDINLSNKKLSKFPEYIQFGKVRGSFNCSHNRLKSLKGSPIYIEISFYCNDNILPNLEHGPKLVGGSYIAHNNQLKSLEGIPSKLNTFSCNNNNLTSLKGLPELINGDLFCNNNKLKDLSYLPKDIVGNLHISFLNDSYSYSDIRKVCYVEENIYIK